MTNGLYFYLSITSFISVVPNINAIWGESTHFAITAEGERSPLNRAYQLEATWLWFHLSICFQKDIS